MLTTRRDIIKAGLGATGVLALRGAKADILAAHHAMLTRPAGPTPPAYWGLYFEAEEPGVVVNMTKSGTPSAVTLETSLDGITWTAFDADTGTTPITLANVGDRVYFRAGAGGNTSLSATRANRAFALSGVCGAHGNIMSLLDGNTPQLSVPTSVCFRRLFYNCTSLTAAPELPAKTLTAYCYREMFYGCTSLTAAPELPALSLLTGSYLSMFAGCTSLSSVRIAIRAWPLSSSNALNNWLYNVSPSGTFYCPTALGTDATITRGVSNCPTGWTVVNTD